MQSPPQHHADGAVSPNTFDIVICGGGLAGLLLARQLRRELPQLSVAVLERSTRPLPEACHKVGESSVELGCQYIRRLGLHEYMVERQLFKWGLRFFPGGGHLPLHERTEIGPCAEPPLKSYQIDRGRMETDLRGMIEQDGAVLIEGVKVTSIDLATGGALHTIHHEKDGVVSAHRARWVLDATGRQAVLRKQQKLTRGSPHTASAGWFRIAGKLDINDLVPKSEEEWHRRPCSAQRWLSTNHFMGAGYWVWVIPLSSGMTSIGAVIHEDTHDYRTIAGLDATLDFIRKFEPQLSKELEKYEIKDFLCLRDYSNTVGRCWSEDRWGMVGIAGAFVDPLFSPGTDFIALANTFSLEMIRTDLAGGNLKEKAAILNVQYRAILYGAIGLYKIAAPIFGHPSAMATKVFFNNFCYWSFTCQYFVQDLCRLDADGQEQVAKYGRRFLELSAYVETLLAAWAKMSPEEQQPRFVASPSFPSILIDAHLAIGRSMMLPETLEYLEMRLAQAHEIVGEIVLRIVQELGPERAQELLAAVEFASWGVTVAPARLELESNKGLARRYSLSNLARDVERQLGPVRRHAQAAEARELLVGAMP